MERRILWVFTIQLLLIAVLVGRLFLLMVIPNHALRELPLRWQSELRPRAELEHFQLLQSDDARGRILYRNGFPWSGKEQRICLPTKTLSNGKDAKIATFLHREDVPPADPLVGQVGKPDVWPSTRVVAEQGRSGLELTFDRALRGTRAGYVGWLKDALGARLDSTVYVLHGSPGVSIRTTIDPVWQAAAQRVLRANGVKNGAVVVLSVPSNEILAMASTSSLNSRVITSVKAQVPGSVFKIVTSAMALDAHQFTSRSRFFCHGYAAIPGVKMKCWGVHGRENLAEAFARSCDAAFAEVGTKLGPVALAYEASRLHLAESGLQHIDGNLVLAEGEDGKIWEGQGPRSDNGYLANTAIGQEDVRLSPLQVALLSATVANGGVYKPAKLVQDMERKGRPVRYYASPAPSRAMSSLTATKIASYMRLTVTSQAGTGHSLNSLPVAAAVKTGTAEVGTGKVNGWVTGFVPNNQPKIAFALFVGEESHAQAHQQVFAMTQALLLDYQRFFPARTPVQAVSR